MLDAGSSYRIFPRTAWAVLTIPILAISVTASSDAELGTCTEAERAETLQAEPMVQNLLQVKKDQANTSTLMVSGELSWTTNVGQKHHECKGSKFDVDFSGTHSGMVVNHGMLLKKGSCRSAGSSASKPTLTQAMTCEQNSTGCHMWCAPVWQSHTDSTDWGAYDARCRQWDGSFRANDTACAKTGKVFTWARTQVPVGKNELDLNFAISNGCESWCSPLWITIYDSSNFAKAYRWCFNRKDDWGSCDKEEDVSLNAWHDRTFKFIGFLQKHGYSPEDFMLELAVYSEFESSETLINGIKLRHVKEVKPTTPAPEEGTKLEAKDVRAEKCGSGDETCGVDHQCCRKGDSKTEATCCPKDWNCCEDSCCPGYYNCTVTKFGHTCEPPIEAPPSKPALCKL